MDIILNIRPSDSLPPEKFQQIAEKAASEGISQEQFVLDAILAKLESSGKEAA